MASDALAVPSSWLGLLVVFFIGHHGEYVMWLEEHTPRCILVLPLLYACDGGEGFSIRWLLLPVAPSFLLLCVSCPRARVCHIVLHSVARVDVPVYSLFFA